MNVLKDVGESRWHNLCDFYLYMGTINLNNQEHFINLVLGICI